MDNNSREQRPYWSILSGGYFAVGLITGIVATISISISIQPDSTLSARDIFIELAPSFCAIFVALASLFVSQAAFSEQRKMRQAGTDPVLIVHLAQRVSDPMMLTLNVSNVGAGAAINVQILSETPTNAQGKQILSNLFEEPVVNGKKKISVILQNTSFTYDLGVGFDLLGGEPLAPFDVSVFYSDIDGGTHRSLHTIDVMEFSGRPASEPPLTKISAEMRNISQELKKINTNTGKMFSEPSTKNQIQTPINTK